MKLCSFCTMFRIEIFLDILIPTLLYLRLIHQWYLTKKFTILNSVRTDESKI